MARTISPIPYGELEWTPSDTDVIPDTSGFESFTYGFRVTAAGDVHFEYFNGSQYTRTYNAGDEFFGRVRRIFSTGTTATGITLFGFYE